jgi:hypothetical protein
LSETTARSAVNPTPSVVQLVGSGAWLSPVERCVRVAEVPGSNPGAPIGRNAGEPRQKGLPGMVRTVRGLARGPHGPWPSGWLPISVAGCLERWQNGYCTRLESERPRGLGGSNPSRSVHALRVICPGGFLCAEVGPRAYLSRSEPNDVRAVARRTTPLANSLRTPGSLSARA